MKSLLKSVVITVIAAGAVLAGSGVASAAPSLPSLPSVPSVPSVPSFTSGPPISCVAPAVEAPAKTVTGTLKDPVGTVSKGLNCLTGR